MINTFKAPATAENPLVVLSLGGGVQSTAMLLMAEQGFVDPRPHLALFADTGWEPAGVYAHIEWLRTVAETPIITVTGGQNLKDNVMAGRNHSGHNHIDIPMFVNGNIMSRQCTDRYKIRPLHKFARNFAGHPQGIPPARSIHMLIGISTDEIMRMKDAKQRYMLNRFPLIDWDLSRQDCYDWFKAFYPDRNLSKSSCLGCPYHSDRTWVDLYNNSPQEFLDTVRVEEAMQANLHESVQGATLHRKGRLIDVVPVMARGRASKQDGFGNECEGYCAI